MKDVNIQSMHSDQEAQREVKQLSRLCKGFSKEVEVEETCEEGEYRQTRSYLDSLDNLLRELLKKLRREKLRPKNKTP